MKMIPWTKALILASTMTVGVACSDSNGGSKSSAPTVTTTNPDGSSAATGAAGAGTTVTASPSTGTGTGTTVTDNTPAAPVNCDDLWTAYVKARPLGFLVAYKITTQTTNPDGSVIPGANSSYEDLVVTSDERQVLSKHTVSVQGLAKPIVSNVNITKDQWQSTCKKGSSEIAGLPTAPSDVTVEILEKGPQSIKVAAGTFAADHVKGKTSATNSESGTVFESWTLQDGSGILVKAATQTTSDIGGVSTVSSVTIELTKLLRP